MIPLTFALGTLLGWCARIIYSDVRSRRRSRETTIAVAAFVEDRERVESGVREMMR